MPHGHFMVMSHMRPNNVWGSVASKKLPRPATIPRGPIKHFKKTQDNWKHWKVKAGRLSIIIAPFESFLRSLLFYTVQAKSAFQIPHTRHVLKMQSKGCTNIKPSWIETQGSLLTNPKPNVAQRGEGGGCDQAKYASPKIRTEIRDSPQIVPIVAVPANVFILFVRAMTDSGQRSKSEKQDHTTKHNQKIQLGSRMVYMEKP